MRLHFLAFRESNHPCESKGRECVVFSSYQIPEAVRRGFVVSVRGGTEKREGRGITMTKRDSHGAEG